MVIDCHYHLEENMLPLEDLFRKMDENGVNRIALMGKQIDPFPEPSKFLIGLLQFILTNRLIRGIGKLFIANFTDEGIAIMGKPFPIIKDPDNEPVFQMVTRYPDRFLGWVFVNPKGKGDPIAELERYKNSPGFVGIKAHPFWNHHTPMDLLPVAERLVRMGKPMIIHAGYGAEGDFLSLHRELPELKLILAHAGFPRYRDTWRAIRDRKNICVDLSQTSYVGDKITRDVVEFLGPERCLFGTDGPYGFHGADGRYDYGYLKKRIERLFPDSGVQRRILGENFAELAGLEFAL
jgi:predicted TIM-barrel fold metal-dependent hydrolase